MRSRRPAPTRHAHPSAGFTLLEMLVALAILALFASVLPQAYGLVRRTWTLSGELARDNPEHTARAFLASRISQTTPIFDRKTEGDEIAFTGGEDSLGFVAPMIHAPKGGGLYRFRIFIAPDAAGRSALMVSHEPHGPPIQRDGFGPAPPAPEMHRLAPAAALRLRYFGRPALREKPQWLTAWSRVDAIPDLVELSISREDGTQMPPLAVELRLRSGQ